MRIPRLAHSPGAVADFYEEALTSLGALCERTWHDRLEVVAEGPSAWLWNDDGALHETELWFPPPEDTQPREAAKEVFPGCPLTFRLAEALHPVTLALERVVLGHEGGARPPVADVAEKLWRTQFPETHRWQFASPFIPDWHFSLLALVRCEIQAIDQHWSLRRVAVSLPDGEPDEPLGQALDVATVAPAGENEPLWPWPHPASWRRFLRNALEQDLTAELAAIRHRQQQHLSRELERLDDYFAHYQQELSVRAARGNRESVKLKTNERLAAAQAEHARRRTDQVARHEIRVCAHLDALLLVAEPAWRARLNVELLHRWQTLPGLFIPRTRRWIVFEDVGCDEARPQRERT